MTILSAQSIRKRGIFTPFHERTVINGLSFGLSPAGYDVRVSEDLELGYGNRFTLAYTIESFDMPIDCLAYVKDKSTWARQFVFVQNTVIEPGWKGHLTLEITYDGDSYVKIPSGSPIAQIIFHNLDEPTEAPYRGKYQNQKAGAQPAIFEGEP